jgi:hypothetical protein
MKDVNKNEVNGISNIELKRMMIRMINKTKMACKNTFTRSKTIQMNRIMNSKQMKIIS